MGASTVQHFEVSNHILQGTRRCGENLTMEKYSMVERRLGKYIYKGEALHDDEGKQSLC